MTKKYQFAFTLVDDTVSVTMRGGFELEDTSPLAVATRMDQIVKESWAKDFSNRGVLASLQCVEEFEEMKPVFNGYCDMCQDEEKNLLYDEGNGQGICLDCAKYHYGAQP